MKLTRNELYELAWSKPMIVLAKEYGFSDGGFAKICRRNQIPIPPRGYWAKKAAGNNVQKIALPQKNGNEIVYIETRKPLTQEDALQKQTNLAQEKLEIEKIGPIIVPPEITNPHKSTMNTRLHFEKMIKKINAAKASKSLPNNYLNIMSLMHRGRISCHQGNCFNVTVSENLVDRALVILDTLVKALELRGIKIQSNKDEKSAATVIAIKDHEKMFFHISEGYKHQPLDKNKKNLSELEKLIYSDKEPVPTGKLSFSIEAGESRATRTWTDGKRLIEDALPAIIYEFICSAPRQKQYRLDQEAKKQQRLLEFEIYREKEAQRYREKYIYDEAIKEALAYSEYLKLEAYLQHLEQQNRLQNDAFTEEGIYWISIVRKVAIQQNPTSRRLKILS